MQWSGSKTLDIRVYSFLILIRSKIQTEHVSHVRLFLQNDKNFFPIPLRRFFALVAFHLSHPVSTSTLTVVQ
ncbi:hypothetical protein NRM5_009420 [Chlamydia psittaci]|nr:hypothetical protein NRM5_009420 [Chlamydia psittaci]